MPGIPAPKHAPSMTPSPRPDFVRAAARPGAPASGSSRQGRVPASWSRRKRELAAPAPQAHAPAASRKTRGRVGAGSPSLSQTRKSASQKRLYARKSANPKVTPGGPRRAGRPAAAPWCRPRARPPGPTGVVSNRHTSAPSTRPFSAIIMAYKCEFTENSPAHCPHCCHTDRRNKPWSE